MTNFIFKSGADLQKISQLIEMVLTEQRLQRSDLATLKRMLTTLINVDNLQKQVDEFYAESKSNERD